MTTIPAPRTGSRVRKRTYTSVLFILMVAVAVVMMYPFWYIVDNAFRSAGQYDRQSGHSLSGWNQLFANLPVAGELLNSTPVCVAAIAIILVVSALMVPLQSILFPEFVNLSNVHLTSSYVGAVLVYAALGAPFATFLMATYY